MIIRDKPQKKNKKIRVHDCSVCGVTFGHYNYRTRTCSSKCARESFLKKRRNGSYKKCLTCGRAFYARKSYTGVFCREACRIKAKKSGLPKYLTYSHDGYIMYTKTPDGRKNVRQHRYIMEQHIGRRLTKNECVHHKNENKMDNRLSNLVLMTNSEHMKYHGEKSRYGSKLTHDKVRDILLRRLSGREYAALYGVTTHTIESIWQRRSWRSVIL